MKTILKNLMFLAILLPGILDAQIISSFQSGNWNATSTWVGGVVPPVGSDVFILNGHSVILDVNTDPNSITIDAGGTLTQNDNTVSLGSAGNITTITVSGNLLIGSNCVSFPKMQVTNLTVNSGGIFTNNAGNASSFSITNFTVNNGANYIHNADGSVANGATADFPGTTSIILGSSSNVSITKWATNTATAIAAFPTTNWGNLTINISNVYPNNNNWQLNGALNTINGSLTLVDFGVGVFFTTNSEVRLNTETSPATMNIQGDFNIGLPTAQNMNLARGGTSNVSAIVVNVFGNFNQTNGIINLGNNNTIATFNLYGNFSSTGGQLSRSSFNTSKIKFLKASGVQTYTDSRYTYTVRVDIDMGNGTTTNTVQLNSAMVTGSGSVLTVFANCTFNAGAFATLNGGPISVAGTMNAADSITADGSGTINISGTVTASGKIIPAGTITITSAGTLNYSNDTIKLKNGVASGFSISGSFFLTNGIVRMASSLTNGGTFNVLSGGIADLGIGKVLVLSPRTATFTASSGSTIKIGSPDGIATVATGNFGNVQTTTRNYNTGANYVYNGATNQITNTGLPTAVNTLTIANTGGSGNNTVTLTNASLTLGSTTNSIRLLSGLFSPGSFSKTISIPDNGTVIATGGDIENTSNGGIFNFLGTGTVSATGTLNFYSVTLAATGSLKGVNFGATGTPTVNGILTINTNRFVDTNPPTYAIYSQLQYATGGTYGKSTEWNATSGPGYPYDVYVGSNTTLDVGNGGTGTTQAIAGNLTVAAGSSFLMDLGSNDMTQPVTVYNAVNIYGTLSLSDAAGGDFKVGGNWYHPSGTFTPKNRTVYLNGNGLQSLLTTGGETFYNLVIDKPSSSVSIFSDVTITNILTLTEGVVTTGSDRVIINSTAANALQFGGGNNFYIVSWINGNLRRNMATNTDLYDFPVGSATTSYLMEFTNDNSTGITYLDASFGPKPGTDAGFNATETVNGNLSYYAGVNNGGVWYLTPDGGYSSGANYKLQIYFNDFSGLNDNEFAILRRADASSNAADWIPPSGSSIPSNGAAGRIVSSGYAERNNVTTFSQFGIAYSGVPLPVSLLSFTGIKVSEGNLLNWATASEINSDHYEIEQSTNGIAFEKIGVVFANGMSQIQLDYQFLDARINNGLNYYRLKMVDADLSYEYSNLVVIGNESMTEVDLYPNPATDFIHLVLNTGQDPLQAFTIHDITGKELMLGPVTTDVSGLMMDVSNLNPGLYIITCHQASGKIISRSFVRSE